MDDILKHPNDETIIGLLETVETEEHKNILPKESYYINFIPSSDGKLISEDAFHEDKSLIPPQTVKIEEILCKNEKTEAEPILTKHRMFQSVSEVESFMWKYMNFSKSAFVKSSNNARQVNNIRFAIHIVIGSFKYVVFYCVLLLSH